MPARLGAAIGFNAIPSLLVSSLNEIKDEPTQRAIYEIQNWANSVGSVKNTPGTATAALGTGNCPALFPNNVSAWTKVSYNGQPAYIPVWV